MYDIILTEDGSPSLNFKSGEIKESMHNRRGALTESLYIYHDAVVFATSRGWPNFMSVGLGLGYNEMIVAAHMISQKPNLSAPLYMESFEKDIWLLNNFVDWLNSNQNTNDQTLWFKNYDQICDLVAKKFAVEAEEVKKTLLGWKNGGQWRLRGKLSEKTKFKTTFNCIMFDAFSAKTNPELWTEEYLINLLESAVAENCVFSTYAATGKLSRSLRKKGFLVEDREGFGGKRECTFAVKNIVVEKN